jgi:hypothetical protein
LARIGIRPVRTSEKYPIVRIRAVSEKADREGLREEIERGQFVRAAQVAKSIGLSGKELQDIRVSALWEMAAVNRNALGTKRLAQEYGLSKKDLKELLEQYAESRRREGDLKPLEPCYHIHTGTYLAFEEWMNQLLRKWEKLFVS